MNSKTCMEKCMDSDAGSRYGDINELEKFCKTTCKKKGGGYKRKNKFKKQRKTKGLKISKRKSRKGKSKKRKSKRIIRKKM